MLFSFCVRTIAVAGFISDHFHTSSIRDSTLLADSHADSAYREPYVGRRRAAVSVPVLVEQFVPGSRDSMCAIIAIGRGWRVAEGRGVGIVSILSGAFLLAAAICSAWFEKYSEAAACRCLAATQSLRYLASHRARLIMVSSLGCQNPCDHGRHAPRGRQMKELVRAVSIRPGPEYASDDKLG